MELYRKENFADSAKVLIYLVKRHPQNSLYWFNLGNCAYMLKKYESAAKYFRRAVALNGPLAPAAKLYLAKSLQRLGKTDEAAEILEALASQTESPGIAQEAATDLQAIEGQRQAEDAALLAYQNGRYSESESLLKQKPVPELSSSAKLLLALSLTKENKTDEAGTVLKLALADPSLSAEDRQSANELLKKVRHRETGKSYWLSLDLSYGWASNIYLDGQSASAVSSPLMRGTIAAGYHFNQGQRWSEKIGYILNYENPQNAPELKTISHTLQSPLIYENQKFTSTLTPYFQRQSWNDVAVSNKVGATLKNSFMTTSFEAGVDLESFSQSAIATSAAYLSGTGYSFRPYLGGWSDFLYGQVYWISGFDGTQDISYSDGSRLPLTQAFQGFGMKALWKPKLNSSLQLNLSSLQRHYRIVALPTNKVRKDSETDASLKYSYFLTPTFSVYVLAEYASNTSTLTAGDVRDENFNSNIVSFGFSWDNY
jgi:tetratricopeptide (TPR) repeat protein